MKYIAYEETLRVTRAALLKAGFTPEKAERLSGVFCQNTLEGVSSHGLNRFPRFMSDVANHVVDVNAEPETVASLGGMEVWDGHQAAGPLVAEAAMARAIELAKTHGIACVSVRNSNHWQRAGRYGWQAVNAGMMGILWTNTCKNMPAWGAKDSKVGNNPFVLAVPRKNGPVVVDVSMSQFAYGRLEIASQNGQQMPVAAGFDENDQMTTDPAAVLKTRRPIPIGFWKGPAMSLALDMIAAGSSLGRTTNMIGGEGPCEVALSQVFIAINYAGLVCEEEAQKRFDDAVEALLASEPIDPEKPVRAPSGNIKKTVERNLKNGLPVNDKTWEKILELAQ